MHALRLRRPARATRRRCSYADELASLGARRVVAVDAAAYFSRPGPRLVDGLELLAHILHPDLLPGGAGRARARELDLDADTEAFAPPATTMRAGDGDDADGDAGEDRQRGGPRRWRERCSIARAPSAPPTRPPTWPPIEIPGRSRKVKTRLMQRSARPMPEPPRVDRRGPAASTKAAAMSPNTAPEAPTVTESALSSSAPNDPASSAAK